jgi:hypothetical protein
VSAKVELEMMLITWLQPSLVMPICKLIKGKSNYFLGHGWHEASLEQLHNAVAATILYDALPLYNLGSINESNLSDGEGATNRYTSEIADRL